MDQLAEQVVHEGQGTLNLLIIACVLGDERGLPPRHLKVLLSFVVGLLRVADEELS